MPIPIGTSGIKHSVTTLGATNDATVTGAIDNLVKGGAGQALQNMNVAFGLQEKTGLTFPGTMP